MPFDEKGKTVSNPDFKKGVVISFDLITENLKRYYSEKSPQGAYAVISNELVNRGFEKLGDSDYCHYSMKEADALDMLVELSEKEKWFPASIGKVIVSPNIPKLDVSDKLKVFYSDVDWINAKDKEYAEKQAIKEKGSC